MKKVVLILLLFFLISCSKEIDKNLVIKDFNINKYLGTWYEIARFNHIFEKNLYNVKAEYSLKDNKIIIKNSGYNKKTGKQKIITGTATIKNKNIGQLKISFFAPIKSEYNIILLDKNYRYAVVSGKNYNYLWILSRNKNMDEELYNKILNKVKNMGFSVENLVYPIQLNTE